MHYHVMWLYAHVCDICCVQTGWTKTQPELVIESGWEEVAYAYACPEGILWPQRDHDHNATILHDQCHDQIAQAYPNIDGGLCIHYAYVCVDSNWKVLDHTYNNNIIIHTHDVHNYYYYEDVCDLTENLMVNIVKRFSSWILNLDREKPSDHSVTQNSKKGLFW